MPSIVTGVIGGIQGASAAKNAAGAQRQGYTDAAGTVNTAVANANPIINTAAQTAGAGVTGAAGAAGAGATTAAGTAATNAAGAGGAAAAGATAAAGDANKVLSPYISGGAAASNALSNLTAAGGFKFNPTDLANTPGYQFAMQQGLRGVNAGAAAGGGLASGATMKAGGQFAQGLASTTYQQQYQDALSAYNTNLNTMLPQAQMGLAASGQAGQNLIGAAQYGGNTQLQAAEYGGTAGTQAAQYAGTAGLTGAEYAGTAGMTAANAQAQNLVNAGLYTGGTQVASGNATAQGDIGSANAWNGALSSLGKGLDTVAGLGFGAGGSWSPANIGSNISNLSGATGYGNSPGYGGGVNPWYGPAAPYAYGG